MVKKATCRRIATRAVQVAMVADTTKRYRTSRSVSNAVKKVIINVTAPKEEEATEDNAVARRPTPRMSATAVARPVTILAIAPKSVVAVATKEATNHKQRPAIDVARKDIL